MHRLILGLALYSLSAVPQHDPCELELLGKWNRFVEDANAYATAKNKGFRDLKLRAKLPKEWESIMRCECW